MQMRCDDTDPTRGHKLKHPRMLVAGFRNITRSGREDGGQKLARKPTSWGNEALDYMKLRGIVEV